MCDPDRERVRPLLRYLILNVGVPSHNRAVRGIDIFAADEEMALLGDDQRPHAFGQRAGNGLSLPQTRSG